jgi:hypothetical protein
LEAIQWAAVAPTLPAPTMLTLFLICYLLKVSYLLSVVSNQWFSQAFKLNSNVEN